MTGEHFLFALIIHPLAFYCNETGKKFNKCSRDKNSNKIIILMKMNVLLLWFNYESVVLV